MFLHHNYNVVYKSISRHSSANFTLSIYNIAQMGKKERRNTRKRWTDKGKYTSVFPSLKIYKIAHFWFLKKIVAEFICFSLSFSLIFHIYWIQSLSHHVISRGACRPCTVSIGGLCVWLTPNGPQSCNPREFARRCVNRWAILKPPLPSNCVSTIITCL